MADAAKPGATGADVNRVHDEFAAKHGFSPNKRYIGHGQGYDMMQAPAINPGEEMVIKENMHLALHPALTKGAFTAMCCDNFRVTKNGAVLLEKTPQELFII